MTITIGGNDSQFVPIAKFCFRKINCQNDEYANSGQTLQVWFNEHVRENVLPDLIATYQQIKSAAPNAAVVVVGYPLLTGTNACPDMPSFQDGELEFFRNAGIFLNQIIVQATVEAGVHFVSVNFDTHEVCGTAAPWINPVEIFTKNREYGLHPTAQGQLVYAAAVSRFLDDTDVQYQHGFFESGLPKNPPPP